MKDVMLRAARIMLVISVTVALTAVGSQAAVAGGSGKWVQQEPRGASATPPPYIEVQCPSISVCYALGSVENLFVHPVLDKTTDGGATWSEQQLDVDAYQRGMSRPLACPTVNVCYLLVNSQSTRGPSSIWITSDGGQTWSKQNPGARDTLQHISCASATVCYVAAFGSGEVGSPPFEDLLITKDAGKTWTSRRLSVTNQPLRAFTCPGIDACYLSGFLTGNSGSNPGGLAVTHDGGATWHAGPSGIFGAVACVSAQTCYALGTAGSNPTGSSVLATTDGGLTWTARTVPVLNVIDTGPGLVCVSAATCYASFAGFLWRTTDGGATWLQAPGAPTGYSDLACPAETVCYAVGFGGKIVKTADGLTWQEPTTYTRDPIEAMACPLVRTCYAIAGGGTVLTTVDGGATWIRHSIGTDAMPTTIACPASSVCFAGVAGYSSGKSRFPLARTTDAGQTWQGEYVSANPIYVQSIACPSTSICLATAMKATSSSPSSPMAPVVLQTTNAGRTWAAQPVPRILTSIACTTTRSCVAVGGQTPCIDDYLRLHGAQARKEMVGPAQASDPCKVIGWLFVTNDAGLHWRRQWQGSGRALLSVACTPHAQCYAGGYWGWGRSTNGRWSFRAARNFPAVPGSVNTSAQPADFIRSLSCPEVSICWGLAAHLNDTAGTPVRTTDGGQSWQMVAGGVPKVNDDTQLGGLLALTCPRVDRCYAGGPSGLIMAFSP